jgi:1,4-alpha-glucan branching enzyme
VAFERAELLFVFNFHPTQSFTDYRIGVEMPGEYKVALDTDDGKYGGFQRVDSHVPHFTFPEDFAGRKNSIKVKESYTHNSLNLCLVLIVYLISVMWVKGL